MNIFSSKQLAFQQAKNTVIVALLLGMLISLVQIGYDFSIERRQVDSTIDQVTGTIKESAAMAVYHLDDSHANEVIKGLFEYKPIRMARILDDSDEILSQKTRKDSEEYGWLIKLFFEREKFYSFPLFYKSNKIMAGRLEISVDIYIIGKNFISRAYITVLSGIVRNIALAFVLTMIFYYTLTLPLVGLVKDVALVEPENPSARMVNTPRAHEQDEIGFLVNATNELLTGFGRSLEERNRAEGIIKEREAFIGGIMESVPAGILTINHELQIESCNPSAGKLFDYELDSLIGMPVSKLFCEPELSHIISVFDKYMEDNNPLIFYDAPDEAKILTRQSKTIDVELMFSEMLLEKQHLIVCVVNDITVRKQIEAELGKYRATLEEKVKERTSELLEANKTVHQSMQALKETQNQLIQQAHEAGLAEMAVGILHNIGNAITPAKVNTSMLAKQLHDSFVRRNILHIMEQFMGAMADTEKISEEERERLLSIIRLLPGSVEEEYDRIADDIKKIQDKHEHIEDIIRLQMSYARIATEQEVVNINVLVEDALKLQDDVIINKDVILIKDLGDIPDVRLERAKLIQIIVNLIKNAVESMETNNSLENLLTLSTWHEKGAQEYVGFSVKDSGIGFEEKEREKMFTFGFSTKQRGTGFGLHSCANYLIANKGSITARSKGTNKGAEFVIKLPVA